MEAKAYPSPEAVVSHLSQLKLTGSRRHSNGGEGGILEGEVNGQPERWFVKFGQDESKAWTVGDYKINDQLRAEFIAHRTAVR